MSDENPYASPEADVTVSESGELAGRGVRLGAAILDGVLLLLIIMPIMFLVGYWDRAMIGEETLMDAMLMGGLGIGGFLLLQGYLLAKSGQTLAKRMLGIQIVSVADDKILSLGRIVSLRYLPVWILSMIPVAGPIFSLIDPIFIFREDRRCIHDLIAGTKVIVAKKS
jgi:uncharacterized RDD family membrane protein YckC